MRRMLEIVYAVEGVAAARVWQLPADGAFKMTIAIAVRAVTTREPAGASLRTESRAAVAETCASPTNRGSSVSLET